MDEVLDPAVESVGDRGERLGVGFAPATADTGDDCVEGPPVEVRANQRPTDEFGHATVREHAHWPTLAGGDDRLAGSLAGMDFGIERRDSRPPGGVCGCIDPAGPKRRSDVGRQGDLRAGGSVDLWCVVGPGPAVRNGDSARVEFGGDGVGGVGGLRGGDKRAEEVERDCHCAIIDET